MLKNRAFFTLFLGVRDFFAQFLVILYRMALRRIMLFNTFTVSPALDTARASTAAFPRQRDCENINHFKQMFVVRCNNLQTRHSGMDARIQCQGWYSISVSN
jgi:hypothetical protein